MATIIYTHTDEAPLLATYSLKPVVEAFARTAGIDVETRDISLAGRILAAFADRLPEDQQHDDALAELGAFVKEPGANIIKLPNISASLPQLKAAIAELQGKGYDLPNYPDDPSTDEEREIQSRYASVKGSAVNPVLREGNSDRRAPASVKNFARKHPHRMGEWRADSKTAVATMSAGDFRHSEQSLVTEGEDALTVRLVPSDGSETIVLRESIPMTPGEIFDGAVLSVSALTEFLREQIARAREEDVLYSVHLKATMMKVSDPVIFGHVVRAFFPTLFTTYGAQLKEYGITPDDGLGGVYAALDSLPAELANGVRAAIEKDRAAGPRLSMVNSSKGITNLHVPSDVIIDASMPAMIRNGGKLWGPSNEEDDTLAVIPDSSYAGVYAETIADCKEHGAFDPATMGSVSNVGLMAKKAEEYGSHDKTFIVPTAGRVEVVDMSGTVRLAHDVEQGDIWRGCQTKDVALRDWVSLAVRRARESATPAVFWLDPERAHDRAVSGKVETYLAQEETTGLDLHILSPEDATRFSLERIRRGEDTISVTGNVLRDYLTDLFPIMELGTSAKMLSIVPLLSGGGLFETGAGGSAPKHVQQLLEENHLRWDSLGEFLALAASLEFMASQENNERARVLGRALDRATETLLNNDESPSRLVGELDNRGSHVHLATYWARELATQSDDADLAGKMAPVADALEDNLDAILAELLDIQGHSVDIDGYYFPSDAAATAVMRPSKTFNSIIDSLA